MCAAIIRTISILHNALGSRSSPCGQGISVHCVIMRVHRGHRLDRLMSTSEETLQSVPHPWQPLSQCCIWVFFETFRTSNIPHMQVKCLIIISKCVRCDTRRDSEPSPCKKKSCPPGLLGFEVQLLDLNQHSAGQGLYRLLWPTSVWCALPLSSLSLTPIIPLHALATATTQTSLFLWGNRWEKDRCRCVDM